MSEKNRRKGNRNRTHKDKALKARGHYQTRYDYRREESSFLVPKKPNRFVDDNQLQLNSRDGVQALIADYERQANGRAVPAGKIEEAEQAVAAIEERFQRWKAQQLALGYDEPAGMPEDLQREHDEALAELDVRREELDKLYEHLDAIEEQETEARRIKVRKQLGNQRLMTEWDHQWGGPRTVIDAQFLALLLPDGQLAKGFNPRDNEDVRKMPRDSLPIIDDPASPFDGLSLADYRKRVGKGQAEWPEGCANHKAEAPEEANHA
jgi:hypothetical protein